MELCRKNDLEEGQARGFTVAGFDRKIILVRRDGRIRAYRDACPHYSAGTPMAWKTDAYLNGARTHLVCHAHGAQFDIDTGKCVSGPCLGQSLTAIPVTINQSGGIEIAAQTEGEESV
ncbi:Rieske (2Fe-2S) protein [Hoeflea sp.]|uniref:Rieske (2Fe-2S) protein n=1 Tax=Hoeflea sp. TaxID=1940281 RepID=UPI0025BC8B09|nr:Rieske (2Fe-2S) protein [Hoeflea sp.]